MDKARLSFGRITRTQGRQIIEELLGGEKDLSLLAKKYGVGVEDLARWAVRKDTRRALLGLCALSDFQTQLLVGKYRSVAAGRLLALANGETGGTATEVKAADVARRACVDVLQTDLKRTQAQFPRKPLTSREPSAEDGATDELRRLLTSDDAKAP